MDKNDIIEKMSQEISELRDLNKLIDSDGIDSKELKARLATLGKSYTESVRALKKLA
jgi:hypothetical protein